MEKMPTRWEPVIGMVKATNAQQLHDYWQKVAAHWNDLQAAGKIKGFSTPAALALSPRRLQTNREKLQTADFAGGAGRARSRDRRRRFQSRDFRIRLRPSSINCRSAAASVSAAARLARRSCRKNPAGGSWSIVISPMILSSRPDSSRPTSPSRPRSKRKCCIAKLPVEGVPMVLSGWSFTLTDLVPWSHRQLILISALMAVFDATLLALLYRDWRLWLIQVATLAMAVCAMIASMKLLHIPLNLLNVLAFRLVLAIGVDYGIYVLLVWQKARQLDHDVAGVVKPVILAGLTAICGFGSLGAANNPTLAGLGYACAIGLFWSLAATIFFTLPAAAAAEPKSWREESLRPRVPQSENV